MTNSTAEQLNGISATVVDSAMEVHSTLGPGLLESAYEVCLIHELRQRGLEVHSQLALPVVYKDVRVDLGYRIDLLVGQGVIVELKALDKLLPVHEAQLLSYLRLSGHRLGLLLNFHAPHLKDGIKRMVNQL
jgi:GxxExxY protein